MRKRRIRIVAFERTRIVIRPASDPVGEPVSEREPRPPWVRAAVAAVLRLVLSMFRR
jgi:hypothetical protein